MSLKDLHKQLRRQLNFLRNSVSLYDEGCKEEEIRMAVVMRVLLHDTGNSTSLFNLLSIKYVLQIVTTAKSVEPELVQKINFGELMSGMLFEEQLEYTPVQKNTATISAIDWWNQFVFIRDGSLFSRKQIVLSAAHKDGGAHVDYPDDDLQAAKEGFWIRTRIERDGKTISESMENNHFRILRRFADELLNSKELLSI
jgi:hypothetical protein